MNEINDIVIIGAGPAGMTAAIYAVRAGLKAIVLESEMYGGQMITTPEVENYPAIQKISGPDLANHIYEQAAAQGADIRFESVTGFEVSGADKIVRTNMSSYTAKAVIIANGAKRRKLECEGEEAFAGRGVSYCATCDGAFFRNRDTMVVGGGNTAIEDALFLSNLCRKVTIVHRRAQFRADKIYTDALSTRDNIEIIYDAAVKRIFGKDTVSGVEIVSTNPADMKAMTLEVQGVFVAVGLKPDNTLFRNVINLDENGYIDAGEDCATNVKGVFAAGDTRRKLVRQIITAASDGAIAGIRAADYVNTGKA